MKQYQDLLNHCLNNGDRKDDRTGVGTLSIFGYQMRFDLSQSFPILTCKRVPFSLVVSELLWFLRGDSNIQYLLEHNNHIWDEWAFKNYIESQDYQGPDMTDFGRRASQDPEFNEVYQTILAALNQRILEDPEFAQTYGDLGRIYGKQWRSWLGREGQVIDQIQKVMESLKNYPDSRRHLVTAWNPEDIETAALPPCHVLFQFYVSQGRLSCQLYQRSADLFLGVPFNIASYALLIHLIAREVGLEVGEFIHTIGDGHIYLNHLDQVKEVLSRPVKALPQVEITPNRPLSELSVDDIRLVGYEPLASVKAPIAV